MIAKEPFLSVVVPAYNIEQYVEQCIQSILKQTFTDFELIIVDDGSTDYTGILCDKYAQTDSRVSVIHKKNGGLVSARKAGLAVAVGEYATYVDGDDWIAEDMFQKLFDCVVKEKADIVICDFISAWSDKHSNFTHNENFGLYTKSNLEQNIYTHMLCGESYFSFGFQPSLWGKIFRKNLLQKYQDKVDDRIRLGEDAACFYPCILDAERVFYMKGSYLYFYRMRETSISHAIISTYYTDEIILLAEHLKEQFIVSKDLKEQLMSQLYMYTCYMLDNMITSHLTFKQLFLDKELDKQIDRFINRQIGREMVDYCRDVRTSSRMKRILRYAEEKSLYAKVNLFLFILYERLGSKH